MPRDDIHNAGDLANVIQREVLLGQFARTGIRPTETTREHSLEPVIRTMLAAIRGTIKPDQQSDYDLLISRKFYNRIANPIFALAQTERFRR